MSCRSPVQFLGYGEAVFIVRILELEKEAAIYLPKVYEKFTSRYPGAANNFGLG